MLLKGGAAVARLHDAFDIQRSLPHGHVAAVLGTLRKLRLDRTIAGADSPERRRVLAIRGLWRDWGNRRMVSRRCGDCEHRRILHPR